MTTTPLPTTPLLPIPTTTTVVALDVPGVGAVDVTVSRRGRGPAVLVLHGGAGPQSVQRFAEALAATADVVTPTHPGFGGTRRPDSLVTIRDLAATYVAFLDALDLSDVTVIGNSVGGWIAAEVGLLHSPRVARLVLLDATGIVVDGSPVAGVEAMTLPEIMQLSFHDPRPFLPDPSTQAPDAQAVAAANRAALVAYTAGSDGGPDLLGRLAEIDVPTLVVWGESDGIATPAYGRAYAAAIPGARFHLLAGTGHMPQLETPDMVITAIVDFDRRGQGGADEAQPFWSTAYTAETVAAPGAVWAAMHALYTGTKLSERSDSFEMDGPLAVGTRLSGRPAGTELVIDCVIVDLVENETFAYSTHFEGLTLTSRHDLVAVPAGGTRITHHQTIAGPDALTVGPSLGARISGDTPDAMDDLIRAAETGW